MLLHETGIPDNLAYLLLGMVLLLTIVGGWVVSYLWRLRNLRYDIAMLEAMAEEEGGPVRQAEPVETAPDSASSPSAQVT